MQNGVTAEEMIKRSLSQFDFFEQTFDCYLVH